MKDNNAQIILTLLALLFIFSCARSYSGQYFSFPPESTPHENDWEYIGHILSWDPKGKNATAKSVRKIVITIEDRDKKSMLSDTFELDCTSIEGRIDWTTFEELTIEIFERGNQYAEDSYNKALLNGGPRLLKTLKYKWDGTVFKEV